MAGCTFCREFKTGDNNLSILDGDVNTEAGINIFSYDVYIQDDELRMMISNVNGDVIVSHKRKIFCCPMCGRRLIDEEQETMQ